MVEPVSWFLISAIATGGFTGPLALGTAATIGGFVTSAVSTIITVGVSLGVSLASAYLNRQSIPTPKQATQTIEEATPSRRRGYGRFRGGGARLFTAVSSANVLHAIYAVNEGRIGGVVEHWIRNQPIVLDGGATGTVTSSPYGGRIAIDVRAGTLDQAAFAASVAAFPDDWTAEHVGAGVALVEVRMTAPKISQMAEIFPDGIYTSWSAVIDGSLVHDPRDAAQDPDDEATWTASDNPALIVRDFLLHPDGYNLPATAISEALFAAAADACDALVDASSGTRKRYRAAGQYSYDSPPAGFVAEIMKAADMTFATDGAGRVGVVCGVWQTPSVHITPADLVFIEVRRGGFPGDRATVVTSRYMSPDHGYVEQDADEWVTADAAALGRNVKSVDFLSCPDHDQCRALMKLAAARLNAPATITIRTTLAGLQLVGERFFRLTAPRHHLAEQVFEIRDSPQYILSADGIVTGVAVDAVAISAGAFALAADEHGTPPPDLTTPPDDVTIAAPTGLTATAVSIDGPTGTPAGVALALSVDAPASAATATDFQVRLAETSPGAGDPGAWTTIAIEGGETDATTGVLIDGRTYDVRARHVSTGGTRSDWTSTVSVAVTVDPTPPASALNLTATGLIGSATIDWTHSASATTVGARVYRVATGGGFGSASLIATVYGAPNAAGTYSDAAAAGTYDWYVAAINASAVEATETGPATATIT